jgi:hypothetical protein
MTMIIRLIQVLILFF